MVRQEAGAVGEARSVLVVGSNEAADAVCFSRQPRLRHTPLMAQRQ
ncbi:hypothetical protein OHA74_52905 [Streptomyces phaeochromogenes]|nr:hypothetical protein [Streptomyces phaeochromogenes]